METNLALNLTATDATPAATTRERPQLRLVASLPTRKPGNLLARARRLRALQPAQHARLFRVY
jgi:hypothetical protein